MGARNAEEQRGDSEEERGEGGDLHECLPPPAIASNRRHRHTHMQAHLLFLSSPPPGASQTEHSRSTHIPLREKGQEEVAWTGLRSKKRRRERKGKGPIGFTVVLYRPRYQKTTYTRISAKA